MEKLAGAAEEAQTILQDAESRREHAIKCSRNIIRETKRMIHMIHVSEDHEGSKKALLGLVSELTAQMGDDPLMKGLGPADDALAEYAEALILEAVAKEEEIPSFGDLGIGPGPWVLGLADCIGEMRRIVLTSLMAENVQRAVSMFSRMEEVFRIVMMFDTPDPILPIRRKQDIARGVMERTRTDITNAVMMSKIGTLKSL
ncbi:MAG: RNA-binding protein [Methanomassiliicoccaceae archaeon]|nr:RNA-binding protein [Methanomassiliicoccaceae archaeon]